MQVSKSPAEQSALAYAEAKLAYARECIAELGSKFPPELHFLHPGASAGAAAGHACTGRQGCREGAAFLAEGALMRVQSLLPAASPSSQ